MPKQNSLQHKGNVPLIWIIVWTLFPPLGIFPLCYYGLVRPLLKGAPPSGVTYYVWVLSLLLVGTLLELPLGSIQELKALFFNNEINEYFLLGSCLGLIGTLSIIYLSTRNVKRHLFIPLKNIKNKKRLIPLFFLSSTPFFLNALLNTDHFIDFKDINHPLLIVFLQGIEQQSFLKIFLGILSIGLLGPFFEEILFRGLLLAKLDKSSLKAQYFLYFLSCLLFALSHHPFSFFFPFIFGVLLLIIRLQSKSLSASLFMHTIWNISLLTYFLTHAQFY